MKSVLHILFQRQKKRKSFLSSYFEVIITLVANIGKNIALKDIRETALLFI